MGTALYLLDPPPHTMAWAPFEGVRPIAELRAGVPRLRERWSAALDLPVRAILSDAISEFHELDGPPVQPVGPIAGPAIIATSAFAVSVRAIDLQPGTQRLTSAGQTVAWLVPGGERWTAPHDRGAAQEVPGLVLAGTYDLLRALESLLAGDCDALVAAAGTRDALPAGTLVLGDGARVIARGATIEPGVVFDTRQGAVILEPGADVRHGTRLEGPCYVGAGSRVLGDSIRTSVIGPRCSVRGEVSSTVWLGYANKSHYGFVGHSIIGHWVNLGAGTTTSNLKNTYGAVRLDVPGARIDTGRINIGSLIGDHAKTAIGTLLGTGTVVGAGANVFGSDAVPKYVFPFAWGSASAERVSEEGFLRVAERVMPRRDVPFTADHRRSLALTYRRMTDGQ